MASTKFLQIFSYILPDYNPADKKHKAINIPNTAISYCSITTSTNNLLVSAKIVFTDLYYNIIVPYLSHKYPPMVLLNLAEVLRDADANTTVIVKDVFKQAFLIDNIQFKSSTNRTYVAELRLVSAHATMFKMFSSYSNNNIKWSDLNICDDINGIFKAYTNATGCKPRFELRDDVFGVKPMQLKRRYVTSTNTSVTDAVLDVIGQVYEPAANERLISDTYTRTEGDVIANRLVGYTIDVDNNSPCFFRLNTDTDYSVELNETKYTKRLIPIRFNGETTADNQGATIAIPPTSSYMSLIEDFCINERFVYYDQHQNIVVVKTMPNEFATTCDTYFHEDTNILSDAKDLYVKSSSSPMPNIPPTMPISKAQYDVDVLNSYIQRYDYSGCNTTDNKYQKLMNEMLNNNIIYLNITNSIGHKVGQVVDLIVQEFNQNNAEHNYNLNLAFSGKWKIVACNWELRNTGPMLHCNETLSLTRCNILTAPTDKHSAQLYAVTI